MSAVLARPMSLSGRRAVPALSLERLWLLAVLALCFTVAFGASVLSSDGWWGIKMGQLTVQAGRPVVDAVFAHAPSIPDTPHGQWLANTILYVLYSTVGEIGVRVVAAGLVTLAIGLLIATARAGGAGARVAALAGLLTLLLTVENTLIRSQLFTLPLFALVSLLVQLRASRPRLLYWLPPAFALWANLHGTFTLGLLFVGLCLVGEIVGRLAAGERPWAMLRSGPGRLLAALVGSAAATLANPLGPGVYAYFLAVSGNPAVRKVTTEWQPPSVHEPSGLFFALSIALLAVVLRRSRRPVVPHEVLLLLIFGYLALAYWRSIVWWGMVVMPILAGHASAMPVPPALGRAFRPADGAPARPTFLNLVLASFILVQSALSPVWIAGLPRTPSAYSRYEFNPSPEVTAFLAQLPEGSRLYHSLAWTGYLAWRLWPAQQPMLDARIEALPSSVWSDYIAVTTADAEWESILARYAIEYLVLNRTSHLRLAGLAERTGRWEQVYQDESAVVLARRTVPLMP